LLEMTASQPSTARPWSSGWIWSSTDLPSSSSSVYPNISVKASSAATTRAPSSSVRVQKRGAEGVLWISVGSSPASSSLGRIAPRNTP
jgi:hypothetical protein